MAKSRDSVVVLDVRPGARGRRRGLQATSHNIYRPQTGPSHSTECIAHTQTYPAELLVRALLGLASCRELGPVRLVVASVRDAQEQQGVYLTIQLLQVGLLV